MNVAAVSLRYRLVVTVASLVVVVGGWAAYEKLGRLEDPAFPIKQAVVTATYPGATPQEVAEEVTDVLERHIQQLGQVDYLQSVSSRGRTTVKVVHQGPSRRRMSCRRFGMNCAARCRRRNGSFHPGAGPAAVNDDFGDVYGVLFYVYGEGFDLVELNEYAKTLRRELLLVQDVGERLGLGSASRSDLRRSTARTPCQAGDQPAADHRRIREPRPCRVGRRCPVRGPPA